MNNYKFNLIRVATETDGSRVHIFKEENLNIDIKIDYFNKVDCFSVQQLNEPQLEENKFKEISRFLIDKLREIHKDLDKENSQIVKT